jgi:hypothetical protein
LWSECLDLSLSGVIKEAHVDSVNAFKMSTVMQRTERTNSTVHRGKQDASAVRSILGMVSAIVLNKAVLEGCISKSAIGNTKCSVVLDLPNLQCQQQKCRR